MRRKTFNESIKMKKSIFFVFALSIGMLNAQTPVDIESAQTITGQKTFTASLLLGTGSPALSFSGATTTGFGRSTGVGLIFVQSTYWNIYSYTVYLDCSSWLVRDLCGMMA